jgi:transcriptional regulator with XRE-family HTH domain
MVDLARLAGVSRRHIAAIEKGRNATIFILIKLAHALELSAIDLGGDVSARVRQASDKAVDVRQAVRELAVIERHIRCAREALEPRAASRVERIDMPRTARSDESGD